MPREYVPSTGQHKRGPKPGSKHKNPLEPDRCGCGKDAIPNGDECYKCGRRLPEGER